jgi:pilus assembly protein CpaB
MDAVERLNRRMLLGAAALGLLAALAAHAYLQGLARRALLPQTVPVVVAAADIPAHTSITAAMVVVAQYPPGDRPAQALALTQDAVGATTTVQLYRGQAVVAPDLSRTAQPASLSFAITPGMRAFTLQVSATSGVAQLIHPADLVDVLAVFSQPGANGAPATTTVDTLEQALQVLAVGQRTVGQNTAVPATYTTVTLEVTPAEAARLAYAGSRGALILTLRSVTDASPAQVPPETGATIPGAQ